MSVFDATRLVRALELHDRWALAVSDHCRKDKRNRIPSNAGVDVTARLVDAVDEAAGQLNVSSVTLMACIQAERRTDPGVDIAGAVNRVIAGFDYVETTCKACGHTMPDYLIYTQYHAEHCPNIGPHRTERIEGRIVEVVDALARRHDAW